jgi:hypothetical protein
VTNPLINSLSVRQIILGNLDESNLIRFLEGLENEVEAFQRWGKLHRKIREIRELPPVSNSFHYAPEFQSAHNLSFFMACPMNFTFT